MIRLLVIGASGAGTSTLGRSLATALSSQHFDVDDFFWHPSDPPFRWRREEPERVALMQSLFLGRSDWVLSGSPTGWGDQAIMPRLTHVVFVTLDAKLRIARLQRREDQRYGERIRNGGDRACAFRAFMEWARGYDEPSFPQRSRRGHEEWLAGLDCPVLKLDGAGAVEQLTSRVTGWLARPPLAPAPAAPYMRDEPVEGGPRC